MFITEKLNRPAIHKLLLRTIALILHAGLNVLLVTWFTNYDITESWLLTIIFILLVLLLAALFIYHLLSFIQFLKTRT
jgi:hypothetical protein